MVIVLTAEAPPITGITTCSLYGPLAVATLNSTGPAIPHEIAEMAALND